MRSYVIRLNLILGSFSLLFLYQNFDSLDLAEVEKSQRKPASFTTTATNPERLAQDWLEYETGVDIEARGEELWEKYGLEVDASFFTTSKVAQELEQNRSENQRASAKTLDGDTDQFRFSLVNLQTLRLKSEKDELNCQIGSIGSVGSAGGSSDVKVSWRRHLDKNLDYSFQHEMKDQRSSMHVEWKW